MEKRQNYITTCQSFLLVGRLRAGKTSFGHKLIHHVMTATAATGSRILGSRLDLQQFDKLDIDRFLAHTLLNTIGEVARQVFYCPYTTLLQNDPFELHPEFQGDNYFGEALLRSTAKRLLARTSVAVSLLPS